MEMKRAFEYAIVLAPAIVTVLILILPPLKVWIVVKYEDVHTVEFAKEMAVHAAFYGTAVATYLKLGGSPYFPVVATAWFAVSTAVAYVLVMRIKQLSKGDDHVRN